MSLTIVHVLGSFEIGGAEMVARNLAESQVSLGHRVHVVSLARGKPGPHAQGFANAGVTVHHLPKLGPSVDPVLPLRLAKLFRRINADIIHSHNAQPLVYAASAAYLARLPSIHTKHGADPVAGRAAALIRLSARLVTSFVAVSQETARDAIRARHASSSTVQVIENGIDLGAFAPSLQARESLRRELGLSPGALVIGTVGRLAAVKNQGLLIRATAPLLGSDVHLVLIGDGPERKELEQLVAQARDPQRIHLLGQRLDVPRLLPGFDIFALTSDSEGLPMVLLEAMACAVPVVCTAVGGIPEVIEEEATGLLVPKGDEAALRSRLQQLLVDGDKRARIGTQAREFCVQKYSWTAMRDRYESLYARLKAEGRKLSAG